MKIEKTWLAEERGTQHYTIKDITVWDLQRILNLLVAEEARGEITHQPYLKCPELLEEIKKQRIPSF